MCQIYGKQFKLCLCAFARKNLHAKAQRRGFPGTYTIKPSTQFIFVVMEDANFLFYNGKISKTGKVLISPDNRSFRYGDGFFETMKMVNGKLLLADYHFERLFASLRLMQFQQPDYFTPAYLLENLTILAKKNYHHKLARVRINIFRGDGGLYDVENHFPHHLIQTLAIKPETNVFNENGLVMGVYKDARKVCDEYSHIKSNNYLSYAMAALWVKEKKLNDVLLLNPYDRVADATVANVFIVKDGVVKTPSLSEGPVNGVMRRYLLKYLRNEGMPVEETQVSVDDVLQASEIFLTNAIYGIKWVKQLEKSRYTNQLSSLLYEKIITTLL
jgi:branched-subunit amino acid aminotransferase/4-amino-4-deoxychorismate lyase